MPIYEYECRACGHRFEKLQKVSDAPMKVCPACEKPELGKLVKLVSRVAFRLKGGGWYETDFKSSGKKNVLSGTDSGADSSGSDSSGGETSSGDSSSDKAATDSKSGDGGKNSNSNTSAAAS